MEELADMIETGVDAESLDIDHGTVLAQTPVLPEPAPEPVLEVKRPSGCQMKLIMIQLCNTSSCSAEYGRLSR